MIKKGYMIMNTSVEYGKLLALYEQFNTLVDDTYKAAKVAEVDDKTSQEEMDILYDRCDKVLDAKHSIDDALEAVRKVVELKATVAQMELQAQELTNRAQELVKAYFEE